MPMHTPGGRPEFDQPVSYIAGDKDRRHPEKGIALCLSGGGYRATVFHLGALWRLNEAAYLKRLKRVSSVSGGSITAAQLGLAWSKLGFDETGVATQYVEQVVKPVRALASRTIDRGAILGGILLPGTIAEKIENAYRKHLFGKATLQNLPDDGDGPRFVINATNVQSGAIWRFSKPYMADYRVGMVRNPEISLAQAVAASSAFPPILSPVELDLEELTFERDSGLDLQHEPYTSEAVLTDGGVYDNLGLETAWKRYQTVLVSDAGGAMAPEPDPKRDWGRHAYRVLELIDNQVRSLRKRQLINSYTSETDPHDGVYWGIRTNIANYGVEKTLPCPQERTLALADTPTRLKRLSGDRQERLINWGYAVCDAGLRAHVDPAIAEAKGFPYGQGV